MMAQGVTQQLKQYTKQHKNQRGATLIGMAFIAGALIFVAIIAMKMAPAYIEFMSVKKVLQAMQQESLSSMSKNEIKDSFDKRRNVAYVEVVSADDLIIEKNDTGDTVVAVQYQVTKPIVANVSVVMDFEASTDSQ
jgi:hypothetical protein